MGCIESPPVAFPRSPRSRGALAACALALLGGGCGAKREQLDTPLRGSRLVVYASAPLHGPDGAAGAQVLRGERLALAQDGGRVGRYRVALDALDAAAPKAGDPDASQISHNARAAAADPRTIAYLGELRSGGSAISIPLLNEAGILQLSPLDSALGLTTHSPAITGSPVRFYPNAARAGRTFARLGPSDVGQADALVARLADEGATRLAVLIDGDAAGLALASAVHAASHARGVVQVTRDEVPLRSQDHRGLVEQLLQRRPDALLYAGGHRELAVGLWHELSAAAPRLLLLAPDALASPSFLAAIGTAAPVTSVASPLLPLHDYPPAAQRMARAFAARYGEQPTAEALYGYESMRVVLAAIRAAEHAADDAPVAREDVVHAFFALPPRTSVLGRYRFLRDGDSTLGGWRVYDVRDGALQLTR